MPRRERSQTEQLRQALVEREEQLAEAHARLAAVEGSTSLRVGQTLAEAARSPTRGLARLPRDLYRLWRGSGQGGLAPRRARTEPVRSYEAERQEARLLSGTVGVQDERLLVAGVLSEDAHATISPYVRVLPLRPHNAQITFAATAADLVLVTASAAAPNGSWANVGEPAVMDRTRALRWVLESAAARGIPSVLVLDAPCPQALRGLGFDQVHRGDLGVPLHRCNPVTADAEPAAGPVWVAGPNARRGTDTPPAALDGVRGIAPLVSGTEAASGGWPVLGERLRHVATAVTADSSVAVRILAYGVRVVLLARTAGRAVAGRAGPADQLAELAQLPGLTTVDPADAAAVSAAIVELRAAGPLTVAERRAMLRTLFRQHAACATLTALVRSALSEHARRAIADPASGRGVTVLAHPYDEDTAQRLATDVLAQLHPPAAIVVPRAAAQLRSLGELQAHGVPLRSVAGITAIAGEENSASEALVTTPAPADWARLAAQAQTPWVAQWHGPVDSTHLLDAVCAAECSQADAVGPAIAPWRAANLGANAQGGAASLPASEQDYVFTNAVRPVLARRELVARGTHPGVWSRHGARLLAVAPCPAPATTSASS